MYKLFNLCKNQKVSRKVKLDEKIINDWECCICYSKLNEGPIKICIPYKCDHITCYQCLCDYTSTIVENENNVNVSSKIICALCRSTLSERWLKKGCVQKYKLALNDKKFYLYEINNRN